MEKIALALAFVSRASGARPRGDTMNRASRVCAGFRVSFRSRKSLAALARDTRSALRHSRAQQVVEMHDADRLAALDHEQLR